MFGFPLFGNLEIRSFHSILTVFTVDEQNKCENKFQICICFGSIDKFALYYSQIAKQLICNDYVLNNAPNWVY